MIRAISLAEPPPIAEVKVDFPHVTDEQRAENLHALTAHARNADWLQHQWPRLLPLAAGKYVAVAGQEVFIAGTALEALDAARAAHPDDVGSFVRYVPAERRPRIYENHRQMDRRG